MALMVTSEPLGESTGEEKRVQLSGEPAKRLHGSLTIQLCEFLQGADLAGATVDDLERSFVERFRQNVAVKIAEGVRDQTLFAAYAVRSRSIELLKHLDELEAREMIAGLEATIAQRQQQGDYWPEGRLNLGIAYACLGEYDGAKRWLEDATNMLRYPSYVQRSEQMAA